MSNSHPLYVEENLCEAKVGQVNDSPSYLGCLIHWWDKNKTKRKDESKDRVRNFCFEGLRSEERRVGKECVP